MTLHPGRDIRAEDTPPEGDPFDPLETDEDGLEPEPLEDGDIPGTDGLDDLASLLTESVAIADARRAAKTATKRGLKLDPALAAIAQTAEAALSWSPECAVARFIESHCSCGASHRRFDGWFIVSRHLREAGASRFTRADDHCGLPSWQYTALEPMLYCSECVEAEALPRATLDTLMGVDALGLPPDTYGEQADLDLRETQNAE